MKWTTIKADGIFARHDRFILQGEGFGISYNPDPGGAISFFAGDDGAETALCHDGEFFILNGDFRKEYEKLVPQGFKACKKFFDSNKAKSSWSNQECDMPRGVFDRTPSKARRIANKARQAYREGYQAGTKHAHEISAIITKNFQEKDRSFTDGFSDAMEDFLSNMNFVS